MHGVKTFMLKFQLLIQKEILWVQLLKELSSQGIKLNITAVYTFEQTEKFSKI